MVLGRISVSASRGNRISLYMKTERERERERRLIYLLQGLHDSRLPRLV